ncbi:uncharacterized protein LOC120088217 [Benincasa hispida]|uniref:uncharacterized protein LOC120088217 n=1 Tax=Benincasa hispida TaxID=102211 RepID=UPI0018FFD5D7|nr:uncharacterized protein LOC120088217 [Benincasa hispida]
MQKIRARMQTTQSGQKSYADLRRKDLGFVTDDKVFLKVAPMKGILRFGKKGKLSPRFIRPFEVLEQIGPLNDNLSYKEKPVEILAIKVKTLHHREITFVKVLSQNRQFKEATWEREDEMRTQYPELFQQ